MRRHPVWAVIISIAASACFLVLVKLAIDWPAFPAEVPLAVQQKAEGKPDLVGTAYVYHCWGKFIDSEQLWRVEVSPELVSRIASGLGARELLSNDEVPTEFWGHWPYWWQPSRNGPGRYFMSAKFEADRRGQDGHHYLIVYDEATSILYVWFQDNF